MFFLPPCLLRWKGATSEQMTFMHLTYEVAVERAATKRAFGIAADEVDMVFTGHRSAPEG